MANGLTVEKLWQAYENEDQSFAQDVYEFFGGVGDRQLWEKEWGMYLPTYDPTDVEFAGLERDIGLQKAVDVFDISKRSAGRTYQGELDTLSTGLGKVLGESETTAGHLGLRSGAFETAIEDTIATSGNKVKDLGDRMSIQADEDENTYNAAIVDTTLDFDKSERESKKDLYDRTLKMIAKIAELGAFDEEIDTDITTPLEEDFNEFSEGYQECAAYCGENTDCMYDCAAAAGEGTTFFDEFFHTDYENIYEDLGDISGFDEDETVTLIDTGTELAQQPTGFLHDACCVAAKSQSLGHCLGRWGKAYTRCRNSYHNTACGGC